MGFAGLDVGDLDKSLVELADVVAARTVDASEERVLRCLDADLVCGAHREYLEVQARHRKRARDAADRRLVAISGLDIAVARLAGGIDHGKARSVNEEKPFR